MIKRYERDEDGVSIKIADIYTADEHPISAEFLDKDVFNILAVLDRAGFSAYIVGGAVRDLLIGKKPKDYDVATDAEPAKIRRLFHRSRIIGKRFRLVHVPCGKKGFIEVVTFRALEDQAHKPIYGTMTDDAKRRDFSCNALYYSAKENQIIDYAGGVADINERKLVNVIPLQQIFSEDPVRIIRGIKYARLSGFSISRKIKKAMKESVPLLKNTPSPRLSEELNKILKSGDSAGIFSELSALKVMDHFLPRFAALKGDKKFRKELIKSLEDLDARTAQKTLSPGEMLCYLCMPYLDAIRFWEDTYPSLYEGAVDMVKKSISPLVFANIEVEKSVRFIFEIQHLSVPPIWIYKRNDLRKKYPAGKRRYGYQKRKTPKEN